MDKIFRQFQKKPMKNDGTSKFSNNKTNYETTSRNTTINSNIDYHTCVFTRIYFFKIFEWYWKKREKKISYITLKENCKENRNITKKLLWLPPGLKSDQSGTRPGFLFPFHHDAILKIYFYILNPQPCNKSHKTPKFNDMIISVTSTLIQKPNNLPSSSSESEFSESELSSDTFSCCIGLIVIVRAESSQSNCCSLAIWKRYDCQLQLKATIEIIKEKKTYLRTRLMFI